jgi:hypothetical protein
MRGYVLADSASVKQEGGYYSSTVSFIRVFKCLVYGK